MYMYIIPKNTSTSYSNVIVQKSQKNYLQVILILVLSVIHYMMCGSKFQCIKTKLQMAHIHSILYIFYNKPFFAAINLFPNSSDT